ncbi:MAG: MarC family protein [Candidatus Syntropharchaeia archaeon]
MSIFIHALITVFVIADPFGNVPIFLSLTENMSSEERRRTIVKAVSSATLILILFALLGEGILEFLNISLNSFKIAGGLLLLVIAFQMLVGSPREVEPGEEESIAVVPMGIPLLAGPGTITSVMIFMTEAQDFLNKASVILAIILAMVGTGLIVINCDFLSKIIKKEGSRALTKIMGIILAAIGIEMMVGGLKTTFSL